MMILYDKYFKYKNINHAENYNVYTIVHYFSALYHMLVCKFKSFFIYILLSKNCIHAKEEDFKKII